MNHPRTASRCLASLLALTIACAAMAQDGAFTIDLKGASKLGYFPVPVSLSADKPKQIVKEPAYRATPKYGVIKLGNGPNSEYAFAVDEPASADCKIYIDKNRNGDLTDDGDGSWGNKKESNGRTLYGVLDLVLRASYGTPAAETSSAEYAIGIYRWSDKPGPFIYRQSTRAGTITIAGKQHKAVLAENDANGLFAKPIASADEAGKTRPVWLRVDTDDDGKFASGNIDVRGPFKLGDATYEASIAEDGSKVSLAPTTKPALDLGPKEPELLKAGAIAPDFTAEKWGGGNLKLSDYKGKVIVLDFWATWCGPCQRSMPHIESVNKALKGQDAVVLGVCVWDDRDAYKAWIPKNQGKYTFQFAFDPAGKDGPNSISGKLYQVSGIPTTYVIDREGKVAATIVGFSEGDTRVEEALERLGIKAK